MFLYFFFPTLVFIIIMLGVLCILKFLNWDVSELKLTLINFIISYVPVVVSIDAYEMYLDSKVQFTEYGSYLIGDFGRTFAPMTGFIFSFLLSILFLFVLKIKRPFSNIINHKQ